MQQICAGRRLAEGKNGEHTVADEFQYFPAMSRKCGPSLYLDDLNSVRALRCAPILPSRSDDVGLTNFFTPPSTRAR
jgi:hypothetical protein